MSLFTVTTEDFETVAVRVPLDTAAAVAGMFVSDLWQQLEADGIGGRGRMIVEPAPYRSKRDGWVHEDFR